MNVNKITKKFRLTTKDSVRFQLISQLIFFQRKMITPAELDILIELVLTGECELGAFCNETAKKLYTIEKIEEFQAKSQNVRNIITKLQRRDIVSKSDGKGKKVIGIHPSVQIYYEGNVLLEYNLLSIQEQPTEVKTETATV